MAWIRILSHQPGIGIVTAGRIAEAMQSFSSLPEAVATSPDVTVRSQDGWKGAQSILSKMLQAQAQPADFIRAVIGSGYRDYLEAEYPNFMERLEDLEQFALFAEPYNDLELFLQEVTLKDDYAAVRDQDGRREDEDKVVLSTIHQSKGLEWKAVFVINLADGAFPNPRALDEEGGLEEERRLFYVAITRSQKHLFLSYPMTSGFDALEFRQPSLFLDEVPDGLFEKVKLKRGFTPPPQGGARGGYNEPTIVLDSSGERLPAGRQGREPKRLGFLRSIDEL
jgi:DNA helicase-2/ATP-dependent DNA helicase PcrA